MTDTLSLDYHAILANVGFRSPWRVRARFIMRALGRRVRAFTTYYVAPLQPPVFVTARGWQDCTTHECFIVRVDGAA